MPTLKTYDLFLSHAWRHNDDYYRLVEMLELAPLFNWRNYSVPKYDPLINPNTVIGKSKLTELLDRQVKPVNCVLFLGGMYGAHSEWILKEIKIAQDYKKPIIGIYPWGQKNMPLAIQKAANELVGWNTSTIVSAIRRYSL
ncbi:MAG: TIR domain-containing protein [Bacteroidetes bacterium]|nr:TIR domain-containing protein [Bacteroidota bacterium]